MAKGFVKKDKNKDNEVSEKPKKQFNWDKEIVIGEIDEVKKNNKIVVKHLVKGGKIFRDIRFYYLDKETGEYKPSKQGICIPDDFIDEVMLLATEEIDD